MSRDIQTESGVRDILDNRAVLGNFSHTEDGTGPFPRGGEGENMRPLSK